MFKKIIPPEKSGREDDLLPRSSSMMVVFCSFPSLDNAREIGREIISEGLAACVNLLPHVESIYRWEGQIQQEPEVLAIFKVSSGAYARLEAALLSKHPYEVPEVVGVSAEAVSAGYLAWVQKTADPQVIQR